MVTGKMENSPKIMYFKAYITTIQDAHSLPSLTMRQILHNMTFSSNPLAP